MQASVVNPTNSRHQPPCVLFRFTLGGFQNFEVVPQNVSRLPVKPLKEVSVGQQQPTAMISKDAVAVQDKAKEKKGPGEETM